MANQDAREKLLDFLDENVFGPVIETEEDDFAGKEKEKFRLVKEATIREKERYYNDYPTAEDIKRNFEQDVTSGAARSINEDLDELGLPKLEDYREEFTELTEELGI
jgi:hypothetical protein